MSLTSRISSLERRAQISGGNIIILIERTDANGADIEKAIVMSKGDAPGSSRVVYRDAGETATDFLARVNR